MQRNVIRKHGLKEKEKFWTRWFRWQGNHKVHKQFKDRLFRFLFEKDKEALLQIYNALNGTHYEDASQLQVVTIENAVYIVMKNDLAFVLAGTMNLYEHQSSYNPNMPVRFLIYLAAEYQKVVQEAEKSLYGEVQRIRRIRTVCSNLQRICSRRNKQTGGTEYGNQLLG